jgi:hypothetical protein
VKINVRVDRFVQSGELDAAALRAVERAVASALQRPFARVVPSQLLAGLPARVSRAVAERTQR